ncbi:hypothetical protein, partial [Cohnella sp. REN36]|nr:hypothetical protein [Cohnella sp. REN36]
LVIRSEPLSITDPNAPVPLTVRLSGQKLINDVRQLYIGPSDTMPDGKATVEMGHLAAFKDGASGKPFTFEGTIY